MSRAVVVGVALVEDGRVLAGCRAAPASLAGMWEFPGGKVEPGEDEATALIRECREELGVEVELGEPLGQARLRGGSILRVRMGRIVSGRPSAIVHSQLRWLASDELDDVSWLPADRPLVAELRRRLSGGGEWSGGRRGGR